MEIRDLFTALRRFWPLSLAVFVCVIALGVAAAFMPAQRYQSTATMIANPVTDKVDYTTVDTVRFLLPSIAAQARTTRFEQEVQQLVPGARWDGVSIDAAEEPDSSIFHITVEAYDPDAAAVIANAAAANLATRKASDLITLRVLDPARPNSTAVSPNRKLIFFAAGVLGLIAAVLSAVAANAIFPRVRSSSEIRRRFGLEVIGEVPNVRGFPKNTLRVFDPKAGHHELVEAFQRLRANFEIVIGDRNVIGITSGVAGEGKSAITANVAWAIAAMGREVVAVDTDLRRPTLHEYFPIRPGIGVADIALGDDIQRLAQPTHLPTLRVIPAGYAMQHPTSILHNAYPRILEAFGEALIVVDMPPILGTADAVLVATMTEAVVLVTDARHGDPTELEQVLYELDRARAEVLGVVLNRASVKRSARTDVYYSEFARRQETAKRSGLRGRFFNGGAQQQPTELAPRSVSRVAPAKVVEPAPEPAEETQKTQARQG